MASTKEYLDFIMGQLSNLEEITYRAMMKEYILYYRGKIVGGIYDDRLLVKPVESAIHYMSKVQYELPYDGAKEMLLVEEVAGASFRRLRVHGVQARLRPRDDHRPCQDRRSARRRCRQLSGHADELSRVQDGDLRPGDGRGRQAVPSGPHQDERVCHPLRA